MIKGSHMSIESRQKLSTAHMGKVLPDITRMRISKAKIGKKNPMWKGDDVGNLALHDWVRRNKPKLELCESCHKATPRDLHNTPGTYKRNLEDWVWLCRRCHMKEDGRLEQAIERMKNPSEVMRDKRRKARLGKPLSEQAKEKLRIYNLVNGNPFAGHKHTEESKRKIGMIAIGRHLSEETKRKISEGNKGKHNKKI